MTISKGLDGSAVQFCSLQHASLRGYFHSLFEFSLGNTAPSAALGNGLSESSLKDCPAIHYLDSVTLLNREGRFCNPFVHVPFVYLKTAPCGRHCQIWLPAWDGACSLEITFTLAFIFCFFLRVENFFCLSF